MQETAKLERVPDAMVLTVINLHREELGYEPLPEADARDLLLVELCAQYGEDRWAPGVLEDVLRTVPDADVLEAIRLGDPEAEHDDLHDAASPFAEVWREACRRGIA